MNHSIALLHCDERFSKGGIKAILLNLFLSDSQGIETFNKLYAIESHILILVLSKIDHEYVAKLAMKNGVQDYLLTGRIDSYSLSRAIRNVIECTMVLNSISDFPLF